MEFSSHRSAAVRRALTLIDETLSNGFHQPIQKEFSVEFYKRYSSKGFLADFDTIKQELEVPSPIVAETRQYSLSDRLLATLKPLILRARRDIATRIDSKKASTTNPEVITILEQDHSTS